MKPKNCAHCGRDLTGASIHTIQGIDVCADIRHCLTRQAEQRSAEAEKLRTEYGARVTYADTLTAEGPIADTLDEALEALADFDAKGHANVVSRELVQRPVGDWREVEQ
jgi:Asp-tRNA(Asn)/Glu-tRNA(Gln) amidotransferase B subunit